MVIERGTLARADLHFGDFPQGRRLRPQRSQRGIKLSGPATADVVRNRRSLRGVYLRMWLLRAVSFFRFQNPALMLAHSLAAVNPHSQSTGLRPSVLSGGSRRLATRPVNAQQSRYKHEPSSQIVFAAVGLWRSRAGTVFHRGRPDCGGKGHEAGQLPRSTPEKQGVSSAGYHCSFWRPS